MKTKFIFLTVLYLFLLAVSSSQVFSQITLQNLTSTILHLDSAFWNAYNNCDTARFQDFVTNDVEFYHDKGGVTTNAKSLIEALNKNICGNINQRVRRVAHEETVKVYPMQKGSEIYGAIISGEHDFFVSEKGKPEYYSGVANFTQLWILKDGVWKMSRILSYNHHEPSLNKTSKEIDLPAKQLDQLTGIYKSDRNGIMTVKRENKVLLLITGNNSFILYPQANTLFFTKDRDLLFEFVMNKTGKPLKIIVKERGTLSDELLFEK